MVRGNSGMINNMRQQLKAVFDKWPMDYANDAEYTDKELVEIQSTIIKKMYQDIAKLL